MRQALAPKELERRERIQERIQHLESMVEKKNQLHNRIHQKRQEQDQVIKAETSNALLTELELHTFRHALQLEIVNTYGMCTACVMCGRIGIDYCVIQTLYDLNSNV